ncbi:MAG: hypothetical protein EXR79_02550 [Myxococcales bacterium]|nr:hypothetical protein [Myxococcales bacterium]
MSLRRRTHLRTHDCAHAVGALLALLALLALAACAEEVPAGVDAGVAADSNAIDNGRGLSDSAADATTPAEAEVSDSETASPAPDAAVAPAVMLPTPCSADADCALPVQPCQQGKCRSDGYCAVFVASDGSACNDGDACTAGEACQAGACTGGKPACHCTTSADCAKLEDGNACNGTLYCDATAQPSVCKVNPASVVACATADDGPCKQTTCDLATGKCATHSKLDGAACDDGIACSVDDTCQQGGCAGGKAICQCKTSADCSALDDGDLCNGTLYCDTKVFPFACKVNSATLVKCPGALDTACAKNTCQKKTGKCAVTLAPDPTPCDDGDKCSADDHCLAGKCKGGANTCPCLDTPGCAKFEDGNGCNGTLFCNVALQVPGCQVNPATKVTCPSVGDTACALHACDPASGACKVKNVAELEPCDDGKLCTEGDHCAAGQCVAGTNTCQCQQDADCAKAEDGNLCNGLLYCDKSAAPFQCKVNPKTVVGCPGGADTPCLKNKCIPATGLCAPTAVNDDGACDADGYGCTVGDTCLEGACIAGTNICVCEQDSDCGKFEDGDVCNGLLYCDKTQQPFACEINPATLLVCPSVDDTACLANQCQPKDGSCKPVPINTGGACNADDNVCTKADLCQAGKCAAGPNTCACQGDADCTALDDANLCNGKMFCDKSKAPFVCGVNPATVVACPALPSASCMANVCQPATGSCQPVPVAAGAGCSDANPCTVGDKCQQGACVAGVNLCACATDTDCNLYDDGNACNGTMVCDVVVLPHKCKPTGKVVTCPPSQAECATSACDPKTGLCLKTPHPDKQGKACDDDDTCTLLTTCQGSECAPADTKDCNDLDGCTVDKCEPALGCVATPTPGVPCDDGNLCTTGDACSKLGCQGGPLPCTDLGPCTKAVCDAALGCGTQLLDGLPCDDGNPCSLGDKCQAAQCAGDVTQCDDGNPCTVEACGPKGCVLQLTGLLAGCNDGNTCTQGDTCVMGACTGSPLQCPDSDPCTSDVCDPAQGCSPLGNPKLACDDKNPCTLDSCVENFGCVATGLDAGSCPTGTCKAGSCGGGCAYGASFIDVQGGIEALVGLAAVSLSDVLAVGHRAVAPMEEPDGFAVRYNVAGTVVWTKSIGGVGEQRFFGVAAAGSFAVAVGQTASATDGVQGWAVAVGADGSVAWQATLGGKDTDRLDGVLALPNGAWLAVGQKGDDGWAVIGDSTGKIGQNQAIAVAGGTTARLTAVAALPGAVIFAPIAVGRAEGAGSQDGWVVRLDAAGKAAAQTLLGGGGADQFDAVVAVPDGGAVAVGQTTVAGVVRPWWVRLDAAGTVTSEWKGLSPLNQGLYGVAEVGVGMLVGVGTSALKIGDGSASAGYAVQFDVAGVAAWQKLLVPGTNGRLAGVAQIGTTLVAVGTATRVGKKEPDGWLQRFDLDGKLFCP